MIEVHAIIQPVFHYVDFKKYVFLREAAKTVPPLMANLLRGGVKAISGGKAISCGTVLAASLILIVLVFFLSCCGRQFLSHLRPGPPNI